MGYMDILGSEFACDRLRHRPQSEFGAGKCRKTRSTAQTCRRTGKEDISLASRQHQACRFASGQETRIAGHFPYFVEHPLRRLQDRKVDVGTDIEDADLERRTPVRISEEGNDLLLLACVE